MIDSLSGRRGVVALIGLLALITALYSLAAAPQEAAATRPAAPTNGGFTTFLPVTTSQTDLLCRFGINGTANGVDLKPLRTGWYVDYQAKLPGNPTPGTEQFPVIRLVQTGPASYDYSPKGQILLDAIAANPGAHWLIGNEPDRAGFQDDLIPELYADAYHELYTLIKGADPTAQILAGTIVQPTPLRLKYLDRVLARYQQAHGQPMPVDGWSIHNFILNEVSCEFNPGNCWGAGIPPGLDDDFGEVLAIDDNDDIDLFKERLVRFRQWMKDNGYRDYPLYLTEYGVLMPQDFGFTYARVNAFMNATFDYMLTAADPNLGDPNDGNRLVQRWSWYSTLDTSFNGWLYVTPTTLSPYGANFASYVASIPTEIDFYPSDIELVQVDPDTYTIRALIANDGNREDRRAAQISFYVKQGAVETRLDPQPWVSMAGCGTTATAEVTWDGVTPGSYTIIVRAATNGDSTPTNNELTENVTIN